MTNASRPIDSTLSPSWLFLKESYSTGVKWVNQRSRDTWVASSRATRNAPYYALGLGITWGSAKVCAKTIAPYLVNLNQVASSFSGAFLESIPMFGRFCQSLIGNSGVVGVLSSACVLSSLIGVLMSSPGTSEGSWHWALLHVALGLAMSPYLLGGLTLGVPLIFAMAVCQSTLTVISTQKICNGENYWQRAAIGVASTFALAPVCSQLTLGMSALVIVERMGYILGSCLIVCSFGDLYMNSGRFFDPSTPLALNCLIPHNKIKDVKLDMQDDGRGTVLGVPSEIKTLVKSLQYSLRQGALMGLQTLLLHGEPGNGKTITAAAIANELGACMFVIKPKDLVGGYAGQSSVVVIDELFKQIRQYLDYHKKPGVIFFDEGDGFFTDRSVLKQDVSNDRERDNHVTAFLSPLGGLDASDDDDNMLVITATNQLQKIDGSIKQRFLSQVKLERPSAKACAHMLDDKIQKNLRRCLTYGVLNNIKNDLKTYGEMCYDNGLAGREIKGIVQQLTHKLNGEENAAECKRDKIKFLKLLEKTIQEFIDQRKAQKSDAVGSRPQGGA